MELTLVEKKQETPGTVSFFFKPSSPVLWTAGQFLIYSIDHKNPDVRGKMRFFSISSAPFEENIAITTKIDGKSPSSFKKALNEMPVGGKIEAKGPDGNFVIQDVHREYVFIAGGIGITPFRSIIASLNQKQLVMNITLLYSNKNEDVLFKDELEKIKKGHPELKIHYFISPNRIDKSAVKKFIPHLNKPLYYISGPNNMVEDLLSILKSLGVEEKKIKLDYFHGYETI